MADEKFTEDHGYFVYCSTRQEGNQWRPSVYFERVADYGKPVMPGVRHNLQVLFDDPGQAMLAANEYGTKTAEAGDIDFP